MHVIPVLRKLRQKDLKFKASGGYIMRPRFKTNKQTNKTDSNYDRYC
jgi:hypothetical protein